MSDSTSNASDTAVRAPGLVRLALEGRAPWEFAALLASAPWLRQLPAGDGHPVVVFPGLAAPDFTTAPLRRFLRDRGYAPQPWAQGFNFGPREGVLESCIARIKDLHARHDRKVSLIGWSLGGIYARELAKQLPDLVRCVITLGSPFAGHPRATNAWRVFELVSGQSAHDPERLAEVRRPPPVPTTSIYSVTDGVVAWQCSLNPDLPHTENIRLHASHVGMGMNPLALYVIADRLHQPEGAWKPFEADGVRRLFFTPTPGERGMAAQAA
jgi:pimeloyl-ACP methyl ester carboxylesterase